MKPTETARVFATIVALSISDGAVAASMRSMKNSWYPKIVLILCGTIGPTAAAFASSCTNAALGVTVSTGACAGLLKVVMGSCMVAAAAGGVEPVSTTACGLASLAASVACGVSVPAIIVAAVQCIGG